MTNKIVESIRHAIDFVLAMQHMVIPVASLVIITVVGALGYSFLLDLSLFDGLYQAVITLSTVGFEELKPFTDGAKMFTIFLVFTGVGTVFYTITMLAATVVEGDLRRKFERRVMMRRIDSMHDHIIVCGYGRVGSEIAGMFTDRKRDFIVVDQDEAAIRRALADGHHAIEADAEHEAALSKAGVDRAHSLVAATTSDASNTYITLTARKLNPKLFIIARSESVTSADKLALAGASRVISPSSIGARRMALAALQPMMADFMDALTTGRHGDFVIAEFNIEAGSDLDGATLAEAFRQARSINILAIRRTDGSLVLAPRGNHGLAAGDVVIVMAEEDALSLLAQR